MNPLLYATADTVYRCSHCKAIKPDHTEGLHCLFAPTEYLEMTPAELRAYREERERPLRELGALGASFIKDMLSAPSPLRSILPPKPVKKEEL